jgi:hypothetical protein
MKDSTNLHLKVQEMCDCYATNDPLKEMSKIQKDKDTDEAVVKWLALAVLHGINNNADKITVQQDQDGAVTVMAKYKKTELPPPGSEIGGKIIKAIREIAHLDKSKDKSLLAIGFRNNSLELKVSASDKKGEATATIEFP